MQERVRAALVTRVQGLAAWGLPRLLDLIAEVRTRYVPQERVPVPVQRFGRKLWQRIVARFPALADLVRDADLGPADALHVYAGALTQVESTAIKSDWRELVSALRDPSAEVAAASAVMLGRHSEPEAKAALLDVLRNPDGYFSPLARVAALQALAHGLGPARGDHELIPALLSAVGDVDAEVSMVAIEAVATHAPASIAIDRLLPVVLDDTGFFLPVVRSAASRALERAGLMTTVVPS